MSKKKHHPKADHLRDYAQTAYAGDDDEITGFLNDKADLIDEQADQIAKLKAENERLRKTEGHYIGCPLRGKLAAGIAPMCTPCTCNEIANEKAESANAPPDDELARLEREIAEEHAQAVIKCFGVADGNWWDVSDLEDFDGLRDDETEDLKDALRYLELRNLLERHPDNPNLVRIKESE